MRRCEICEDILITIVDGVFSGSEICATCNTRGEWKITKFWSEIADKNDDYNSMIEGWKYEIGYWTKDNVVETEYFDDKKEAELYLEECIKKQRKANEELYSKSVKLLKSKCKVYKK